MIFLNHITDAALTVKRSSSSSSPLLHSTNQSLPSSSTTSSLSLNSVFIVLRHGDRTPTEFYPNDPFQNVSYWPEGIGELNEKGIERMRWAGKLYRDVYARQLTTDGWTIYAKSSTRKRSIESLEYFLEHFLDLHSSSAAAPINLTELIRIDQKMLTTSYPCDRSNRAWLRWFNSPNVTDYLESKRNGIEYLSTLTGEDYFGKWPYTLRQCEFLCTTLEIERDEYHLAVPEWATNTTNMALIKDLKRHAFLFDWCTPTVQRYRVGPLLGEIRDRVEMLASVPTNILGTNNSQQRLHVYSTHDVNQVLLLQSLHMYEQIDLWPTTYSSAIVFEAYRHTDDDKIYLRALYRQIPNQGIQYVISDKPLNITDCMDLQWTFPVNSDDGGGQQPQPQPQPEWLCELENYKKLIFNLVPINYDAECAAIDDDGDDGDGGSGGGAGDNSGATTTLVHWFGATTTTILMLICIHLVSF